VRLRTIACKVHDCHCQSFNIFRCTIAAVNFVICSGVRLPLSMRSVFSHFLDLETGTFINWESLVPSTDSLIAQDPNIYFSDSRCVSATSLSEMAPKDNVVIMTIDTVRYSFLTSLLLLNRCPVLLVGK